MCADDILIPMDCGDLSMDAMVRFIEFVDATREEGHTNAKITGIVLTMRDGRPLRYERDVAEGIRAAYGALVFNTEIRRRIRIKEIPAIGVNLEEPAMDDYVSLVEEFLDRTNREETA